MTQILTEAQERLPAAEQKARALENAAEAQGRRADSDPATRAFRRTDVLKSPEREEVREETGAVRVRTEIREILNPAPGDTAAPVKEGGALNGVPAVTES